VGRVGGKDDDSRALGEGPQRVLVFPSVLIPLEGFRTGI
jgi:hypothetical protein